MLPFIHLPVQAKNRLKKLALTAGSGLTVLALATGCARGSSTAAAQSESAAGASAASASAASESASSASASSASASAASAKASEEAEAAERAVEAAKSEAAEASASAEAEASASASAQAEKDAAEAAKKKTASAKTVTSRELQRLVKDPSGHVGETVVVFGRVTQFDSVTGQCTFRASIGHTKMRAYSYNHNAMFVAGDLETNCPELDDVLEDDQVKVTATMVMPYSYSTTMGGTTTVPLFKVEKIQRV